MGSYNRKRSLSHKALRLTARPPIDEKKKNVKMGTSSPVILPHQTGLIGTAGMADCTPLKKGGRYVAAFWQNYRFLLPIIPQQRTDG